MYKIDLEKESLDLNGKEIKELFKDLTIKKFKASKNLRNIIDKINQLPTEKFLFLRRQVTIYMVELSVTSAEFFDALYDLISIDEQINKIHVGIEQTKRSDSIKKINFSKIFNKKIKKNFLPYLKTIFSEYKNNPYFFKMLYDLSDYFDIPAKKSFLFFCKKNSLSEEQKQDKFYLAVDFLAIRKDDLLQVVAKETGQTYLEIAEKLLSYGANPTLILLDAVKESNIELVDLLIKKGADVDHVDQLGNNALFYATERGEGIIVDILLSGKADPNLVNKEGSSALIYAADRGDLTIIDLLLNGKADINIINKEGNTALLCASNRGNKEIIKILLDAGADYKLMGQLFRQGMIERRKKYLEILIMKNVSKSGYGELIDKIAEGEKDKKFKQRIELSKRKFLSEFQQKILENKEYEESGDNGEYYGIVTPDNEAEITKLKQQVPHKNYEQQLVSSIVKGDVSGVKEAIKNGANVNYSNPYGLMGSTLLHLAVWKEEVEITKILLAANITINVQDVNGDTSVYFAIMRDNAELVRVLLENKGDLYLTNNAGITPLEVAKKRNNKDVLFVIDRHESHKHLNKGFDEVFANKDNDESSTN